MESWFGKEKRRRRAKGKEGCPTASPKHSKGVRSSPLAPLDAGRCAHQLVTYYIKNDPGIRKT